MHTSLAITRLLQPEFGVNLPKPVPVMLRILDYVRTPPLGINLPKPVPVVPAILGYRWIRRF